MSAPRGKSLSLSKDRVNITKSIKNFQVKDEMTHVPATLYKFSNHKSTSGLPILPFRSTINDISAVVSPPHSKEASPRDMGISSSHLKEMLKADIFSKTMRVNQVLKFDKEHMKVDFSKKTSDVSYLMETKAYIKERKANEHSANTMKRSIDLLSPKNQVNIAEYSILSNSQCREEKPGSRRDKGNIYLEMKGFGKDEANFSDAFRKFRLPQPAEDSPERRGNVNRSIDMEVGNLSRTLPKIIDSSKLGSTFDLPENPDEIKDNFMTKVKKGIIVQKRAQNKNLNVPSGRKEVVSLSDWLATMLEDIQKNKTLGLTDLLDQTQLIYTVCLEEIIRQVKIQCSERGQLLEKIWEAYTELFNKAIDMSHKEKKQLENFHFEEMARLEAKYGKEIESKMEDLNKNQQDLDEKTQLLEKHTERNIFLEGKTERMTKDIINLKHDLHIAQTEIQRMINNPIIIKSDRRETVKGYTSQQVNLIGAYNEQEEEEITETDEQTELEESTSRDLAKNKEEIEGLSQLNKNDVETDTIDLKEYAYEDMRNNGELLDKSVQWEDESISDEEGVDVDKIVEQEDNSDDETHIAHSAQEMMDVQNLEEVRLLIEALDKMTVIELEEIEREIRIRLNKEVESEVLAEHKKKKKTVSFAKDQISGRSVIKKKNRKERQISPELGSARTDKGTTKEDIIELLEKYQEDNVYPSLKEIPAEDEVIQFMLQFLKGDDQWKLPDLKKLIKKLTKRKAHSLNLDYEDWDNKIDTGTGVRSLTGDADQLSQTIKSLTKADLEEVVAELERKLEEIINGNEKQSNSQEVIEILKLLIDGREDFLEGKNQPLFRKIIGAYEQSVNQNMELKIENKEQDIDLQEMADEQRKNENKARDLFKQIDDYQEKNQRLQKTNEKLAQILITKKTLDKETISKKLEKLGIVINDYTSRNGLDSKDSKDEFGDTTERERINALKSPSSRKRGQGEAHLNIVDDFTTTIKMPYSDFEEEWSDSEDRTTTNREDRKKLQRSSSRVVSMFASPKKSKTHPALMRASDGLNSKKITRVTNINGESANALLVKAKEKKNVKSALTKASLLKFMSQFYTERLKDNKKSSKIPLHVSVYDFFMNKYGLKKVAETKCLQIYESAIAFSNIRRIQRFKELLGLGESFEVIEELDLYLSTFRQLDLSSGGTLVASNTQERIFIGLDQAEAAVIGIFESKLDPQSLKELLLSLPKLKSVDRASRVVDLEDVVDKLFYVRRNLQDAVKRFVKEIFGATDLDNDETIEFFEFNILYKQVEKDRYDRNEAKELFFEHADLILSDGSNEPVLSFNKFAWICLEMKLFSEEKQRLFARVSNSSDSVQTVQDLEHEVKQKLNEIRLRFIKSQTYTPQVKNIMTKLYSSVKNPQKPRNIVWLSYRLLDEESKSQLLDYEMSMMLPKEFSIIQRFVDEIEGWVDHNYID